MEDKDMWDRLFERIDEIRSKVASTENRVISIENSLEETRSKVASTENRVISIENSLKDTYLISLEALALALVGVGQGNVLNARQNKDAVILNLENAGASVSARDAVNRRLMTVCSQLEGK
jgi:hypothetical protein